MKSLTELRLGPGVSLLLEVDTLSPTAALALTQAAAPLLTRITALGLDKD